MIKALCVIHKVAWVLLIVGGLNWGLVGLFGFDLVTYLFGSWMWVTRLIYILVGMSAVLMLAAGNCCMTCEAKAGKK